MLILIYIHSNLEEADTVIIMMNQNPGEPHGDHRQHWQEMFPDGS